MFICGNTASDHQGGLNSILRRKSVTKACHCHFGTVGKTICDSGLQAGGKIGQWRGLGPAELVKAVGKRGFQTGKGKMAICAAL